MKTCFIVMPFTKAHNTEGALNKTDLDNIYKDYIKKAVDEYFVEDKKYFDLVSRYDNPIGSIIKGIVKDLKESDLVIADLTGSNPNVMYELGVRHSLKRGTIMLTQNLNELPSDFNGIMTVTYKYKDSLSHYNENYDEFKRSLHKAISQLLNSDVLDSPVLEYINVKEMYKREDEIAKLKELTVILKTIYDETERIDDLFSESKKNPISNEPIFLELIKFFLNNLHSKFNLISIHADTTYLFEDIESCKVLLLELVQKFSAFSHYSAFKNIPDMPFGQESLQNLLEIDLIDPILLKSSEVRFIKLKNLFTKDEIIYKGILQNIAIYIGNESEKLDVYDEIQELLKSINQN